VLCCVVVCDGKLGELPFRVVEPCTLGGTLDLLGTADAAEKLARGIDSAHGVARNDIVLDVEESLHDRENIGMTGEVAGGCEHGRMWLFMV